MGLRTKSSLAYLICALLTVALAYLVESAVLSAIQVRGLSALQIRLLNVVPALLAGSACFGLTAVALARIWPALIPSPWHVRILLPVVLALTLVAVYIWLWTMSGADFGLIEQLVLWPMAAILAGLLSEVCITQTLRKSLGAIAA